jgi:uncharacterized OB-fold protein
MSLRGRAAVVGVADAVSPTGELDAHGRALEAPYVVALIDLDEGVRLLSNVVGCPPERVAVGDRVRVTWEPLSDGRGLPLFQPVD